MTEPRSDRLLLGLGERVSLAVVRGLLERSQSQAELVHTLKIPQATLSRTITGLRKEGLVVEDGTNGGLGIGPARELTDLLLAADRVAERVLALETQSQRERSRATRRLAIRPADSDHENRMDS